MEKIPDVLKNFLRHEKFGIGKSIQVNFELLILSGRFNQTLPLKRVPRDGPDSHQSELIVHCMCWPTLRAKSSRILRREEIREDFARRIVLALCLVANICNFVSFAHSSTA
jgi:hypothetical protein